LRGNQQGDRWALGQELVERVGKFRGLTKTAWRIWKTIGEEGGETLVAVTLLG
jgi:hypothetical protein